MPLPCVLVFFHCAGNPFFKQGIQTGWRKIRAIRPACHLHMYGSAACSYASKSGISAYQKEGGLRCYLLRHHCQSPVLRVIGASGQREESIAKLCRHSRIIEG